MVEYLSGNRIQGSSTISVAPSPTGLKLIKRSTPLGSDGDSISSGTFTAKDNLQALIYIKIPSGNSGNPNALLSFNGDGNSDTDYAQNYMQGTSTGTSISNQANQSVTGMTTSDGMSTGSVIFTRVDISNMANVQKLLTYSSVFDRNGTTKATAPCRIQGVGKYDNGSLGTNITSVDIRNNNDGTLVDTDSEIIVLGVDNDDNGTSGTNFWQKLAYAKLDSNASGNPDYLCNQLAIPAKKYLWIREHKGAAGSTRSKYIFNNESDNYAIRANDWQNSSGSADAFEVNGTTANIYNSGGSAEVFTDTYILNTTTSHKLCISNSVEHNSDGAGNTPAVGQFWWKWCNNDQITSLTIKNDSTSGNFGAGSEVTVWGAD